MSLRSHLNALESAGLVRLVATHPDLEYLFRHALVQEAAYASLLLPDRRRLHLAVGEALEVAYPDRREELAPQLARHFTEAGAPLRAFAYYLMAGTSALAAYANQEAEGHFRAALALVAPAAEGGRADAWYGLGRTLARQGRYPEAMQAWHAAIEIFQALGDTDMMARCYAYAARAAWYSDPATGLTLSREGLARVGDAPDGPGLAALIHEAGRAHYFSRETELARAYCQRALAMAERLGAIEVQAETLCTLGLIIDQAPEQAIIAMRRAMELAETAGLPATGARAHINLSSLIASTIGDLRSSRDHALRAAELSRRQGNVTDEALAIGIAVDYNLLVGDFVAAERACQNLHDLTALMPVNAHRANDLQVVAILLHFFRGAPADALPQLLELRDTALQRGDDEQVCSIETFCAEVALELQNLDAAAHLLELTIPRAATLQAPYQHKMALYALTCVRARQGRPAEARTLLAETRRHLTWHMRVVDEARLTLAEALIAIAEHEWASALAYFAETARLFDRYGMRWWRARIILDWSAVYEQRGTPADLEHARSLLRDALILFEYLECPGYVERVQERIAQLDERLALQAIAMQQTTQELAMAAEIQAGLLPTTLPHVPGWQFAALLLPARETAGDFYDIIPLPDELIGIVIADVADKGMGAALYMALTRTLIRNFASEYGPNPEKTLAAVNERILQDTQADLFVTTFYGVLDPQSGTFTYCNAGHNPPLLIHDHNRQWITLTRTGMVLGVVEHGPWTQAAIQFAPGDTLLLYTDGLTEAQNTFGDFFGTERLIKALTTAPSLHAEALRDWLVTRVTTFSEPAPRYDDMTLVVVMREAAAGAK